MINANHLYHLGSCNCFSLEITVCCKLDKTMYKMDGCALSPEWLCVWSVSVPDSCRVTPCPDGHYSVWWMEWWCKKWWREKERGNRKVGGLKGSSGQHIRAKWTRQWEGTEEWLEEQRPQEVEMLKWNERRWRKKKKKWRDGDMGSGHDSSE